MELKSKIREFGKQCGIQVMGFTSAEPFEIEIERMAELEAYYNKTGRGHTPFANRLFRQRLIPKSFYPRANAIIVAAHPIAPGNTADRSKPGRPQGIGSSNYARKGRSWYQVLEDKMDRVAQFIRSMGHEVETSYGEKHPERTVISTRDSLLLRAAAVRAGIARRGKNTILHNDEFGSYMVLSALLTSARIEPDKPSDPESNCGNCNACIKACPHDALNRPFVLDVQNCKTILGSPLIANSETPIPDYRRREHGIDIRGCDLCQAVCPKNRKLSQAHRALASELDPDALHPDILAGLNTPLPHNKMARYLVAAGNAGDPAAIAPLTQRLAERTAPARLRVYAAWALGRINAPASTAALEAQLREEEDPMVRGEILAVLRDQGVRV